MAENYLRSVLEPTDHISRIGNMPKLIAEMTQADLATASPEKIAESLIFRLRCATAQSWNDLDILNDRRPGLGEGTRNIIAGALEVFAQQFRGSGLPHWNKVA
jgi:hypothetical protein